MFALKTKKGIWGKFGQTSGDPMWPGGYKGYMYLRDSPDAYAKTPQQEKVGNAGRLIAANCKGKKGSAFTTCRHEQIKAAGL